MLDIAGGEILLYKDAIKLIKYCASKGIKVNLTTNATLIDDRIAEELVASGLYSINLSLDGLEKTHEYMRNQKNIYFNVENAIFSLLKHRKSNNPNIHIATVITKHNIEELMDLIRLVNTWIIDGITFQALDHNFGAEYHASWFENNEFWPDDLNKVEAAMNNLIDAKNSGNRILNSVKQLNEIKAYYNNPEKTINQVCLSGDVNFIIDEYGGIRLCWNMQPLGNILTQDPEETWYSKIAFVIRENIYGCRRTCRILNCNHRK